MNFTTTEEIDELDPMKTPFAFDSAKFRLLTSKEEQLERQMKRLEALRKTRAKEAAFKDSVMTKIRIGEERTTDLFRRRATIIQEKARIKEVTRRERAKLRATMFEIQERNRLALKERIEAQDAALLTAEGDLVGVELEAREGVVPLTVDETHRDISPPRSYFFCPPSFLLFSFRLLSFPPLASPPCSSITARGQQTADAGPEPWLPALRTHSMRRGTRSLTMRRRELHRGGWENRDDEEEEEEGEDEEVVEDEDEQDRPHVSFQNVQRYDAETGEPLFPMPVAAGTGALGVREGGGKRPTLAPIARRRTFRKTRKRRKRRTKMAAAVAGAGDAGMLAPYAEKQKLPRERAKGKGKGKKGRQRDRARKEYGGVVVPGSKSKITALYWGDEDEQQGGGGVGGSSDTYHGGLGAKIDRNAAAAAAAAATTTATAAAREQEAVISEQAAKAATCREIQELRKRQAAQLLKLLDAEKTKEIEREAKELIAQESGDRERIRSIRDHFRRERAASRKKLNIIRREFESELVVKLTRAGLLR